MQLVLSRLKLHTFEDLMARKAPACDGAQGAGGNMKTAMRLSFLAVVALVTGLWPSAPYALTFSNSAPITIPATGTSGPATPYPSSIIVSGVVGVVTDVDVTLSLMNHTFPDDIDILLVGPTGAKLLIMSDAGGSADLVNNTYTFDDGAASTLADGALNASGSYKPSNFGTGDTFPAPAPLGPYTDPQLLSVFNFLNPNGTWSLYVFDDVGGDIGNVNGGWSLEITVDGAVPEPTTLLLLGAGLVGLATRKLRRP